MKLAEALILRADLQKRIEQLESRLNNNLIVQEGDEPNESPEELLKELDENIKELTNLIIRINKTNNNTIYKDDISLADILTKRDGIWKKRNIYANIVETGSVKFNRYSQSEIRYIATMDIKNIQSKVDELSKEWRELDTSIQGFNWTIDLE